MKLKLKNVTKAEMKLVLETSKSMREAILHFGMSPNGSGGYRNIKKKITDLGLEIPKYHYYGKGAKQARHSNEIIFVEHSTFPRHRLKKRIIDETLFPYKCETCPNEGT